MLARVRFARAPHAGDRTPDLRLTDSATGAATRLFDVLRGPHFTLLVFLGLTGRPDERARLGALTREVEQRLGPDVRVCVVTRTPDPADDGLPGHAALHDRTGAAHRRYGVTGEALYLIRPDGYVGFRAQGRGEAGVLSYLDGVLTGSARPGADHGRDRSIFAPRRRPSAAATR